MYKLKKVISTLLVVCMAFCAACAAEQPSPSAELSTAPANVSHTIGDEEHRCSDTELTVREPEEMALLGDFYKLETLTIAANSLDGFDLSTLGSIETLRALLLEVGTIDGTVLEQMRDLAIESLVIRLVGDDCDSLNVPRMDALDRLTVYGNVGELNIAGGDALGSLSLGDGSIGLVSIENTPSLDSISTESGVGKLVVSGAGDSLSLFAYRPIDAIEYDGAMSVTVYTDGFDLSILASHPLKSLQLSDWYDYDLTPLKDIELVDGLTLRVEDQENETIAVPKDSELLPSNSSAERKKSSLVSIHSKETLGREEVNIYPPDALYALETDFGEENIDILVEFARQGGTIHLYSRYNCKPRG